MPNHLAPEPAIVFQLKSGHYPITTLQLLGTELSAFEQQLTAKIQQAPKFFYHAPVVLDLQRLNRPDIKLDFKAFRDILLKVHLIPVGIKGGHPKQQEAAIEEGLPVLHESQKKENPAEPSSTEGSDEKAEIRGSLSKVITEPVRSGQQIYVRGGDLIVLAPVSHGAELLADGHIHVYAPLRGRALAGVTGDQSARILCQSLEAELISIAGQYKISEDIEQTEWRTSVDIALVNGRLHIQPF